MNQNKSTLVQAVLAALCATALMLSGLALLRSGPSGRVGAVTNLTTVRATPKLHATQHVTGGDDVVATATTAAAGLHAPADKLLWTQLTEGLRYWKIDNEDFLVTGTAAGAAAVCGASTSLPFAGDLSWRCATNGAATAVTAVTTGQSAAHHGVIELSTGTATTGIAGISRNASGVANRTLGAGVVVGAQFGLQIPNASDGTNTFAARVGFANSAASTPTDMCAAEYTSAAGASGTIICRTCSASSCNNGTGGTPPTLSGGTWYRVDVDYDGSAGSPTCQCKVDGTVIGTQTSTIPTAALTDFASIIKSAGGTARTVLVDIYKSITLRSTPSFP